MQLQLTGIHVDVHRLAKPDVAFMHGGHPTRGWLGALNKREVLSDAIASRHACR